MHTMDLTRLSDALPYSTRYNSKIGRESMDIVMLDACMKNRNVTSVAMARRGTEVPESRLPRTPCGEEMMRPMGHGSGRAVRALPCRRAENRGAHGGGGPL